MTLKLFFLWDGHKILMPSFPMEFFRRREKGRKRGGGEEKVKVGSVLSVRVREIESTCTRIFFLVLNSVRVPKVLLNSRTFSRLWFSIFFLSRLKNGNLKLKLKYFFVFVNVFYIPRKNGNKKFYSRSFEFVSKGEKIKKCPTCL